MLAMRRPPPDKRAVLPADQYRKAHLEDGIALLDMLCKTGGISTVAAARSNIKLTLSRNETRLAPAIPNPSVC